MKQFQQLKKVRSGRVGRLSPRTTHLQTWTLKLWTFLPSASPLLFMKTKARTQVENLTRCSARGSKRHTSPSYPVGRTFLYFRMFLKHVLVSLSFCSLSYFFLLLCLISVSASVCRCPYVSIRLCLCPSIYVSLSVLVSFLSPVSCPLSVCLSVCLSRRLYVFLWHWFLKEHGCHQTESEPCLSRANQATLRFFAIFLCMAAKEQSNHQEADVFEFRQRKTRNKQPLREEEGTFLSFFQKLKKSYFEVPSSELWLRSSQLELGPQNLEVLSSQFLFFAIFLTFKMFAKFWKKKNKKKTYVLCFLTILPFLWIVQKLLRVT